jgi:hypothetical protein
VACDLNRLIADELRRPAGPAVTRLASELAERAAGGAVAVLFYGSALAADAIDGILDFYVLVDKVGAWPGPRLAALANRLLPPHVGYSEHRIDGKLVRAKYAVLSMRQYRSRMTVDSLDTTLWARFCQPCACVFRRSADEETAVAEAVRTATITAARWAALLGPERGDAASYWRALFTLTYGAELRVETIARGADLVDRDAARYARYLPAAWEAAGIEFDATADGILEPRMSRRDRAAAARRWALRRRFGKVLNLLRLTKAAFTFEGATDYVAWKVERHTGFRLDVRAWERRHPLMAAPGIYWRLRKRQVLR